jgi:NADP-dependent 3-hydroxy acid dehydrogenase YdfG
VQVAVLEKKLQSYFNQGWNVIATMRNPENETELKQLENVLVAKLDVLELDSIKKRLRWCSKFGNVDVLQ